MTVQVSPRDYSLSGAENARAVAAGLASAEWYHSEVPRKVMKDRAVAAFMPTAVAG